MKEKNLEVYISVINDTEFKTTITDFESGDIKNYMLPISNEGRERICAMLGSEIWDWVEILMEQRALVQD